MAMTDDIAATFNPGINLGFPPTPPPSHHFALSEK